MTLLARTCNTWLIDGAEPALIDAGVPVPEGIDDLARRLGGRALARVLITHVHPDHVSGLEALRTRWPAVIVYAWQEPAGDRSRRLADGDVVEAGDVTLTVLHTPGHAPDHVCFWDEARRWLYTGDMIVQGSSVMIPARRGGHLRSYLASLERLAALDPERAYPGHGSVIEQPRTLIDEYLSHRRMREEQVIACLRAGVSAVDDIVARIYPDLPGGLKEPATQTIEAHLEKLREDGRLSSAEDRLT